MAPPSQEIEIPEFRIEDIETSASFIFVAPPGSGKTTCMENICYFLKHRYPVARLFVGEEDAYLHYCNIFPPLFVSNEWNEEEEKMYIKRQKMCKLENGDEYVGNSAINMIDDAIENVREYYKPLFSAMFKKYSRHGCNLILLGTQYANDFPPAIRSSASYVFIGRNVDIGDRKKLFENFGGVCGTQQRFNDLMDQITGDHTFLVIKKRSESNAIENCVFYYQTIPNPKNWKFGCDEYIKWHDTRYNTKYIDSIDI